MIIYKNLSVRRRVHCLLVAVFLIFTGCATTIEVETEYDPTKEFSAFREYAWYHKVSAPSQVVRNRIRTAVDTILYRKGYRIAEPGVEPDFRVSFTAVGEPGLREDEVSSRLDYDDRAWSPPVSADTRVREYIRGTLVIDVVEPVQGSLLWRGTSSRSLEPDRMQSDKMEDILEIVNAILERFPPQAQE